MENTNNKQFTLLEVNNANIESIFKKIHDFANERGYGIMNQLKTPTNLLGFNKSMHFDSNRQKKTLRNYLNRLDKHVSMRTANKFLHFLYKKVYKLDHAPSVELSEKEAKIQACRKAWKKAFIESEKLRVAYQTEKGDFYKPKQTNIAA